MTTRLVLIWPSTHTSGWLLGEVFDIDLLHCAMPPVSCELYQEMYDRILEMYRACSTACPYTSMALHSDELCLQECAVSFIGFLVCYVNKTSKPNNAQNSGYSNRNNGQRRSLDSTSLNSQTREMDKIMSNSATRNSGRFESMTKSKGRFRSLFLHRCCSWVRPSLHILPNRSTRTEATQDISSYSTRTQKQHASENNTTSLEESSHQEQRYETEVVSSFTDAIVHYQNGMANGLVAGMHGISGSHARPPDEPVVSAGASDYHASACCTHETFGHHQSCVPAVYGEHTASNYKHLIRSSSFQSLGVYEPQNHLEIRRHFRRSFSVATRIHEARSHMVHMASALHKSCSQLARSVTSFAGSIASGISFAGQSHGYRAEAMKYQRFRSVTYSADNTSFTSSCDSFPSLKVWRNKQLPADLQDKLINIPSIYNYSFTSAHHLELCVIGKSVGAARREINRVTGLTDQDYLVKLIPSAPSGVYVKC